MNMSASLGTPCPADSLGLFEVKAPRCVDCSRPHPEGCPSAYDDDGETWAMWLWCEPCDFWTEFPDDRLSASVVDVEPSGLVPELVED